MRWAWLFFALIAHGNAQCPPDYSQAPNWGYCYKLKSYYDWFLAKYDPKTFDEAMSDCRKSGGDLASIHSQEENDYVMQLQTDYGFCETNWRNIGLKCIGKDCHWVDGSPLTYTNFYGEGPTDDGKTECYGMPLEPTWKQMNCDAVYTSDCWVCSAKPKEMDCSAGETPYHGGCASVYTWPADQNNAEAFCPEGGHLASIHSQSDNSFYAQLALDAGINGTIYIGGQFSSGMFEWVDGSNYDALNWANGFPNTIFGSCVQMLLASEFGVRGKWTNVECSVKQPYICSRSGNGPGPTGLPPTPKADSKCPPIQYFTGSGFIYSPNYPVSIPSQQTCEYVLTANEGTKASVIFHKFNCQSGTSLALFDGLTDEQPFIKFTTNSPPPNQVYTATSNVLKIVFSANGNSAPQGTGWEAEFTGK